MLDMFRLASKGWALLPPPGRVSLIYVDDLARLLVALVPSQPGVSARIFEADDGVVNGWSHESFARAIGAATGKRLRVFHAPRFLLKVAASGDSFFRGRKAKLTQDRASYLSHPDWTIDPGAKPPSELWVPMIETLQGLKETTDWYKAQGWL